MIDRENIIRMAREALKEDDGEDYYAYTHQIPHWWGEEDAIIKFANLVAAAERNRIWTQDHWTEYERSIVATEREAIATEFMKRHEAVKHLNNYWHHAANYVRERGQHD